MIFCWYSRLQEEADISLIVSVYDTIRNITKLNSGSDHTNTKEVEETKNTNLDYLSPFLVNYVSTKYIHSRKIPIT